MPDSNTPDLRGGHRGTAAFILGPILAALIFLGGLVWQAAQYPSRSEFNAAREKIEAVDKNVAVMGARMETLTQGTSDMKNQQQRIETKLDDLTEHRRK